MARPRFIHKLVMAAGTADESAGFAQEAIPTCRVFLRKSVPAQGAAKEIIILFFHNVTAKKRSRKFNPPPTRKAKGKIKPAIAIA